MLLVVGPIHMTPLLKLGSIHMNPFVVFVLGFVHTTSLGSVRVRFCPHDALGRDRGRF